MKLPISVIILTFNEENNIVDCLKSVCGWADEIFIVDSYSCDATLKLAGAYTEKIYQHPFGHPARQRNWAQDNLPIRNEWVFHLDADERVSIELVDKLNNIFSSGTKADGFMFPRRTVFRGRWIKHGLHYPVFHLRVFKKSKGRSEERLYDQHYIVKGEVAQINADMINIINTDLNSWKTRHKRWACLEAREVLFNKGRVMNINRSGNPIERRNWLRYNFYYKLPLFIRCFLYFFYRYIIKFGFLDGAEGLVFHFWQGFWYRFLVDYRIMEITFKHKIMKCRCS